MYEGLIHFFVFTISMTKYYVLTVAVLLLLVGGVWYWSLGQSPTVVVVTPTPAPATTTTPTPEPTPVPPPSGVYHDATLGFTITLPTPLASTTNSALYHVDNAYSYTAMGPGKAIAGVKFTIPGSMASGTNLSSDTYISVEHLALGKVCDATTFLGASSVKSQPFSDGGTKYTVATSTDAAAGNRYEEYVYALASTSPCMAVRYFVHYGAIENYPAGAVKAFNKAALLAVFDQIRSTLELRK